MLVIDKTLSLLPRRKTDNAIIVRAQDGQTASERKAVYKLNVTHVEPAVLVDRGGGKCERQHRFTCQRCALQIGYSNEPIKSAPFFYLLGGALTQVQGCVFLSHKRLFGLIWFAAKSLRTSSMARRQTPKLLRSKVCLVHHAYNRILDNVCTCG